MKILITSPKPILTQFGRLPKGMTVDVPEGLAQFLILRGEAAMLEIKTGEIDPSPTDEKPKTRGRPKKAG
jgi:hypothetical protein